MRESLMMSEVTNANHKDGAGAAQGYSSKTPSQRELGSHVGK